MSRWTRAVEAAHVVSVTALVAVVAVDPTAGMRSAPDWSGWVSGQQRLDRVMSRLAPPLFLTTGAAAAGAALVAGRRRPRLAAGRAAAAVCTGAAVAVTLRVNEPANAQIRAWRPQDEPPDGWRDVRAGWEHGHRLRRALVALAGLAALWGGTAPRRGSTSPGRGPAPRRRRAPRS